MTIADPNSGQLEGRTAWIFSDGKAGHEAQCLGVVDALGLSPQVKRADLKGIYKLMAPWGPLPAGEGMGTPGGPLGPPWPTLAFATGRTTIPYIRALKRRAGLQTYTVILMDPKTGPSSADLIWVPEHDRRRGANVVTTLTAPHRFSPKRLAALRATIPPSTAALPKPRIACLVGGPNGDYRYTDTDEERLVQSLTALSEGGAGLMITTSRRTPERLASRIKTAIVGRPAVFWDGAGQNPYPDFLAHADAFVITADSVSMVCEAAATGRPIFLFSPSGGSAKFDRFHASLAAYGATRPLPTSGQAIPTWSYTPLHSAETIAAEIRKRWSKRAAMLPGLVNARP
ncbi:MAG: mitochondrial fission ELM1 family protein [Proteobacteria bacterium]|nr:mitochondrial fission ELM1 family protein [Pseudomonadota bacterium]